MSISHFAKPSDLSLHFTAGVFQMKSSWIKVIHNSIVIKCEVLKENGIGIFRKNPRKLSVTELSIRWNILFSCFNCCLHGQVETSTFSNSSPYKWSKNDGPTLCPAESHKCAIHHTGESTTSLGEINSVVDYSHCKKCSSGNLYPLPFTFSMCLPIKRVSISLVATL